MTRYVEYETSSGLPAYIRGDRLEELGRVDVVVFDCDGVLLDVRGSYSMAVAETTSTILEAMTSVRVPENLFDGRLNQAYKRTGGFNNDWTLSYALIMRTLAELPDETLEKLNEIAGEALNIDNPIERLKHLLYHGIEAHLPLESLYEKLTNFAGELDDSGWEKVDGLLLEKVGANVKRALRYPGGVGESVISTLLEELLCGVVLFEQAYGIEATFTSKGIGLIENETAIIAEETIEELENLLGGDRIGIASGSISTTAMHALKGCISRISDDAQVWYETVEEAQNVEGVKDLHKPAPYSLLRASRPYEPYYHVLYVGDTMSDFMMARNSGEPSFLFAGVYRDVHCLEDVREGFLSNGADVVAPSVNELPEVLKYSRGETN